MKNIFKNTLSIYEKVALAFFLALFVVPEVLWSPVLNFVHFITTFSTEVLRSNYVHTHEALPLLVGLLFVQGTGVFLGSLLLVLTRHKFTYKRVALLCAFFALSFAVVCYLGAYIMWKFMQWEPQFSWF